MNRAIKHLISVGKLTAEATVGWKRVCFSLKSSMKESFQSIIRRSNEWKTLISVLLKSDKTKKNAVKRNLFSTSAEEAAVQIQSIVESSELNSRLKSVVQHETESIAVQHEVENIIDMIVGSEVCYAYT
jgi:RNase P protein component